mmetsp:Transcript_4901/g.7453  ORF Transcript_4901/g.7453 Transcript_4901/m.7453 type:complete len:115 (+) Transcript_4901:39-383(+)
MKFSSALILAAVASTSSALAPPAAGRRAFLAKATTTAASFTVASVVASPAFAKDDYSLDTGDVAVAEKKVEKNSKGSNVVVGALAGSVLLSLPFFLPNLMRLAGINNAKNPDKK